MRALVALLLVAVPAVAVPAIASAEPSLQCNFEGRKHSVVIVNPDNADKSCLYSCAFWTTEGGTRAISGSTTVRAGRTVTVDADEGSTALSGVRSTSLECK